MANEVNFSIVAGEVISPGVDIKISTSHPVSPRTIQSAIILQRDGANVPIPVKADDKGTTITVSTKALVPGNYQLQVQELVDTQGKELLKQAAIPLRVCNMRGKVPAEYRVEHATGVAIGDVSRLRLDVGEDAPPGYTYVEFAKAVHKTSGKPADLAFNEKGQAVDGPALLDDYQKRRFAKFGNLHEALYNSLATAKDSDSVKVTVWPQVKQDLAGYVKPDRGEIKHPPPAAVDLLKHAKDSRDLVIKSLEKLGAKVEDSIEGDLPVYASLNVAQARGLSKLDGAGKVFLDDRSAVKDLADSEAIARIPQAQALGYTGAGVHVAVFEGGPSNLTNLQYAARYSKNPESSDHARLTSAIIKNTEPGKPHGYAPGCSLYSANSYSNDALKWAVSSPNSATVISQSFHRVGEGSQNEEFGSTLSGDDILKDYLALQWPFPTIVHAAGNGAKNEYVNHKGFNTISVASHNDTAMAIAGDSVFRNPASSHSDRELPEIAANGTGVTAVGIGPWSGTSFAAPAVAGVAALIQSVDATLKSWPEGTRAILMAGADRNISGGPWTSDLGKKVDQSDGAGAVNAQLSVLIAQQRRGRNAAASPRGWDVGTLTKADFGQDLLSKFRYHINIPVSPIILLPLTYTVKVAMAWDSKITTNAAGAQSSVLTVDYDLIIRNSRGVQVAISPSWDNSYEIAEFEGYPGESYEVIIRLWSGTDSIWFGLAWNVSSKLSSQPASVHGL